MLSFLRARMWLLAVALLNGGAWATAAPPTPPAAPSLPVQYLPDDTDFVTVVNIRQIVASPLFRQHFQKQAEMLLKAEPVRAWLRDSGFDPLRDLDRVILVMGRSLFPVLGESFGGVLLVQGRFDTARLQAKAEQLLKAGKAKVHPHGKGKIYEVVEPSLPKLFVALVDSKTLFLAPRKGSVADALDKAAGTKKTVFKHSDLLPLLRNMRLNLSVQVAATRSWVIQVTVTERIEGDKKAERSVKYFTLEDAGFTSLEGTLTVGKDILGQGTLMARNEEQAQQMAKLFQDNLKGVITKLKEEVDKDKRLAPVLKVAESIRVSTEGPRLMITGRGDADAIQALHWALFHPGQPTGVQEDRPTKPNEVPGEKKE